MPRFARKKDGNHESIAQVFRDAGWAVISTYQAPECPDFFAAHNGRTVAIEVKSKGGKLTPAQEKFKAVWPGEYYVISTVPQARQVAYYGEMS